MREREGKSERECEREREEVNCKGSESTSFTEEWQVKFLFNKREEGHCWACLKKFTRIVISAVISYLACCHKNFCCNFIISSNSHQASHKWNFGTNSSIGLDPQPSILNYIMNE